MNSSTQRAKPSFYDICISHSFNSEKLRQIAAASGVHWSAIEAMCNGNAVRCSDARKVLKAFSQFTDGNWTLKTVNVPLTNETVGHG